MKKAGYQLSSAYIAYIMDPRNFLDETNIFQFQSSGIFSLNDTFDQESNAILKGTFMEGTKTYSNNGENNQLCEAHSWMWLKMQWSKCIPYSIA